ncbi:unnamed protein product, partial [Closterium sp. NIES-53]
MHSRIPVSGLPRSLPPLPASPAPPCLPCVEGRQRAAPHFSFPPTTAPLQTLHMDVLGPARVSGLGRERYFLLVFDDYMRYTTVFPLRNKGEVPDVLIPWIRAVRLQLRERFRQDLPVLRLHSNRDAPHWLSHGGLSSMIHAAAPQFLWPFAVRYATHQLNLWPRVSLLETSPTLRWTWEVGDVSVFWVWGSRAFVLDTSADKLSARAIPCVFLGFPPNAPGQFYHPTSCRVFPSQDVTFDESVPFYRAAIGTGYGGAASRGAELASAEPGGAEPAGAELGGAECEGVEPGGAERPAGASPRLSPRTKPLSPQQLREWLVRRARLRSGAAGVRATGDSEAGGAGVTAAAGGTVGPATAGPRGARTRGSGAAGSGGVAGAGAGHPTEPAGAGGTGAGGAGAGGAGAVDPGAGGAGAGGAGGIGAGGTVRPYFVPLFHQTGGLTERCEPASSSVCTGRRVPRSHPSPVPGTHAMALLRCYVCPRCSLLDFAAACRLDYASALVAESESASHPSVGGECALGTDVFEDNLEDFECLAAAVPRFASMLLAPEGDPDASDIPTLCSYAEAITGEWHDTLRTTLAALGFTPSTADPSLFLRTDTSLLPLYVLVYVDDLDFATADIEALTLVKSELQKRQSGTDLGELRSYLGLQITRDRARRTITLTQSHMVHQVLQHFGFLFSLPQPTPLSTGHSLSA